MTAERVRRTAAGREISSRPAAVPSAQAAGLLEELAGVRLTAKRVERGAGAHGAAGTAQPDRCRLASRTR